jgi:RNA polymerase sigma factor (sigma-70 family)
VKAVVTRCGEEVGPEPGPVSSVRLVRDARVAEPKSDDYPRSRMQRQDPLKPLAEAARTGDPVATRRFLEAIGPSVLRVLRATLGPRHRDLEDVFQEALVAIAHAIASFRGDSSVLHFARSVALRRGIEHRRGTKRGHEVELDLAALRATGGSPIGSVVAGLRRSAFRAMLLELRAEQAEALVARTVFGYSIEEIADQSSVPVETVRSRLRLAKTALRARIERDATFLELSEMDDVDAP